MLCVYDRVVSHWCNRGRFIEWSGKWLDEIFLRNNPHNYELAIAKPRFRLRANQFEKFCEKDYLHEDEEIN